MAGKQNKGRELKKFGADCIGCMTVSTYEKALKGHLHIPKQEKWLETQMSLFDYMDMS